MSDTKTIIIGSAPVFRGEYTNLAIYYRENLVTYYSCVFRAIGDNFSNIPPISVSSSGYITIVNRSAWEVVIDNTNVYNLALQYKTLKIKTINNQSLLGEGNIVIEGGSGGGTSISIDSSFNSSSTNPVTNQAITERFDEMDNRLEEVESGVIPITYWQTTSPDVVYGKFYFDSETGSLYYGARRPVSNGTVLYWNEIDKTRDKLYVNLNTGVWYRYDGNTLLPIGFGKINIANLNSLYNISFANGDNPLHYAVTIMPDDEEVSVGILSIYATPSKDMLVQEFSTTLRPDSNNRFNENCAYDDTVHKYCRMFGLTFNSVVDVGLWSEWRLASGGSVDVDDYLDSNSDNAISNRAVTAALERIEQGNIHGMDNIILPFDDFYEGEVEFYESTSQMLNLTANSTYQLLYMVDYNVFAVYTGGRYVKTWYSRDGSVSPSSEYNENGIARTDRRFSLYGADSDNGGSPSYPSDDSESLSGITMVEVDSDEIDSLIASGEWDEDVIYYVTES